MDLRTFFKTVFFLLLAMTSLCFNQHSVAENITAFLLISGENKYSIIRVPLDELNTTHHLANKTTIVSSIDYDFKTESIFWFNYTARNLFAGSIIEGREKSVVVHDPVAVIFGISYDWIHDNIYWTDLAKQEICVSNKNGTFKKVLFNERPNALFSIVVNPLDGHVAIFLWIVDIDFSYKWIKVILVLHRRYFKWMYWADNGNGKQRIERAAMDGTRREVILTKPDISQPHALTIDFDENRLYWTQDNPSSISSSNFDGSDIKLILAAGQPQFDTRSFTSIATFEDSIYWVGSPGANTIYKANKFDGSNLVVAYESTWPSSLNTVKVYASSKQPPGENHCAKRIQICSHFCFPVPAAAANESISTACACPDGLNLSPDGLNCI